ncbi:hypothetical protein C1890_29435 [Pseudomonas sp. DP16D-R1]|nr:hypothetical protein C1890_29435 [Pseudomonas sp. DP16D-R1]
MQTHSRFVLASILASNALMASAEDAHHPAGAKGDHGDHGDHQQRTNSKHRQVRSTNHEPY